ncbi:MAG: hypothetical protein QXF17_04555 [Ignisphaera sp.]
MSEDKNMNDLNDFILRDLKETVDVLTELIAVLYDKKLINGNDFINLTKQLKRIDDSLRFNIQYNSSKV